MFSNSSNHSSKIPVICLVSAGRSGSTLLDLVMDAHSQIIGVGELFQYKEQIKRRALCSCGKEVEKCPFWQKVFAGFSFPTLKIFQTKLDFLFAKQRYWANINGKKKLIDLSKYIQLNEEIYKRIIEFSGKSVVFDSSKDIYRAEALLKSKKLEVTLLHLVRDGRGVAWSWKRAHPERSVFHFMKVWAMTNLKIEIAKLRHWDRFIFVRYEDFVQNPQQVLEKILERVGLKFEPTMLNFREKERHQVGGNLTVRFKEKTNEIKEDLSWRENLSLKEKFLFNLYFGWLNLFYQTRKSI